LSYLDLKGSVDFPFVFSETEANKALTFFKMIKHTSGKLAGTPFNLQGNQAFKVAMIFGWRRIENGKDAGRRFTQVYIEEARKGGKSQFAAAVELYCGLCEGEEGAEIYTAATTRDQADMVFLAVKKMAKYLTQDSQYMRKAIKVMANSVVLEPTDSFIRKVSADAGTLDGLNPHCAVIDEYHAHKNDHVKGVMQTGMGSRSNPLLLIITTAGFNKDYPCYSVERANAVEVLKGNRKQDNLFAIIFTLDEGDDWQDPAVWKKANPNLGSTPTVNYLQDQVQDALNKGASTRVQVLTKNFNVWLDTPKIWIPEEDVKAAMQPISMDDYAGQPCYVGIDLAATKDVTAAAFFFPAYGDRPAALFTRFWLPEETVKKRVDDTNYLDWVHDGHIISIPGNVADYAYIRDYICKVRETHNVQMVSYDQWNSVQMMTELTAEGFNTQRCYPNFRDQTEPTKWLEKAILAGNIVMNDNPVLLWMFRNVVLDFDSSDNIKINKDKSADKIDGVAASIMAIFGWLTKPQQQTSYLLEDGAELLKI
jgi:phage terminase large subunit-like protein